MAAQETDRIDAAAANGPARIARPALAILIVSWRVRDPLRACLLSLAAARLLERSDIEVLVVDNASGDGTPDMLAAEFPGVSCLVLEENLGFGRANTLGFARTTAPCVLLLNPDTLVEESVVPHLLATLRGPGVAIVGCRLLEPSGALQRWTAGDLPGLASVAGHYLFLHRVLGWLGLPASLYLTHDVAEDRAVGWVSGACMMVRRDAMPEPLFDPAFFLYGEDVDLCRRTAAGGGGIVYTPAVSVVHAQGQSMRQQTGRASLAPLIGMRMAYVHAGSARTAWLYDLVTVLGFAIRFVLFRTATALRDGAELQRRARSSGRYLRLAARVALRQG